MRKLIVSLALIIIISTIMSSCSPKSFAAWMKQSKEEPELMNKVDSIYDEATDEYNKLYKGQVYKFDKLRLFTVTETARKANEEDVLLSWFQLPLGIGYLDEYYSYTDNDPIFIYMPRLHKTYVRSDYNYETDTFAIEGIDYQFVFSDMLTSSSAFSYNTLYSYPYEKDITLYSTTCPRLQVYLRVFYISGTWFAGGNDDELLFEVSNEYLELLNIKVQVN